jgi:lipoprotein-anchoring transpeptidase ErfK/SrfK
MKSSLEHKTVRPGSLTDYSFYYSHRNAPQAEASTATKPRKALPVKRFLLVAIILSAAIFGFNYTQNRNQNTVSNASPASQSTKKSAAVAAPPTNNCAGNGYDKFIKISVSKRKLWACEGQKTVHNAPVITGIEKYDSTRTPAGTYKIYAKAEDTVLTGKDEVGEWKMPVDYWMPFLDNQYGTYGFHDATWRKDSEFGKVDPYNGEEASHGCVELPLASQKWLYEWAPVGTILTVEA